MEEEIKEELRKAEALELEELEEIAKEEGIKVERMDYQSEDMPGCFVQAEGYAPMIALQKDLSERDQRRVLVLGLWFCRFPSSWLECLSSVVLEKAEAFDFFQDIKGRLPEKICCVPILRPLLEQAFE